MEPSPQRRHGNIIALVTRTCINKHKPCCGIVSLYLAWKTAVDILHFALRPEIVIFALLPIRSRRTTSIKGGSRIPLIADKLFRSSTSDYPRHFFIITHHACAVIIDPIVDTCGWHLAHSVGESARRILLGKHDGPQACQSCQTLLWKWLCHS